MIKADTDNVANQGNNVDENTEDEETDKISEENQTSEH